MKRRIAALGLALLLAACASPNAPRVRSAADPGADFSQVHSYSWLGKPDGASPEMQQAIVQGIDTRLQARGWRLVAANGDVHVDAHVSTTERERFNNGRTSRPGYLGWGGFGPPPPNSPPPPDETVDVGTLVVDMFNGTTRREMWRGTASSVVNPDPARMNATLQAALDRMFSGFPPGK